MVYDEDVPGILVLYNEVDNAHEFMPADVLLKFLFYTEDFVLIIRIFECIEIHEPGIVVACRHNVVSGRRKECLHVFLVVVCVIRGQVKQRKVAFIVLL